MPDDRQELYDRAMVQMHVDGMKIVDEIPKGYAKLDSFVAVTEKGVKANWRGREVWLPKRSVAQIRNRREFYAPYPLLAAVMREQR
ncbi:MULTISPECIES: hypothetical protein [unclassified Shinella]|uniref:hypothetical protein n=1 Tax=unclassified Shinella TaxID=2643062 RepID=UPI00225D8733|nr:hypothetical protein SHINE37_44661 [Rhizobiaceae bacterium]CAK7259139.1 protein of unknown function [Shinella sp. WSC3-e]